MERLTMIDGCGNDELARCMDCGLDKAGADLENCGMCEDGWQRALRKLAAYEDTGLEPEQIMELKSFTQGGIHKVDDGWKHVQELLQAEQDGLLRENKKLRNDLHSRTMALNKALAGKGGEG